MACLNCEKRREWIRQQLERAKQSWQLLMQRDNPQVARSDDSPESVNVITDADSGNTESAVDLNRGSEQSVSESSSKLG